MDGRSLALLLQDTMIFIFMHTSSITTFVHSPVTTLFPATTLFYVALAAACFGNVSVRGNRQAILLVMLLRLKLQAVLIVITLQKLNAHL